MLLLEVNFILYSRMNTKRYDVTCLMLIIHEIIIIILYNIFVRPNEGPLEK